MGSYTHTETMRSSYSRHLRCRQQESPMESYTHAETMCSSYSTPPGCSQQEAPMESYTHTQRQCVAAAVHTQGVVSKKPQWEATLMQRQCVAAAVHTQGVVSKKPQWEATRTQRQCITAAVHTKGVVSKKPQWEATCTQRQCVAAAVHTQGPMGSYTHAETMCSSCSTHPGCSQQEAQLEKRYTFTKSLEPEKSEIQFIATAILKRFMRGMRAVAVPTLFQQFCSQEEAAAASSPATKANSVRERNLIYGNHLSLSLSSLSLSASLFNHCTQVTHHLQTHAAWPFS